MNLEISTPHYLNGQYIPNGLVTQHKRIIACVAEDQDCGHCAFRDVCAVRQKESVSNEN